MPEADLPDATNLLVTLLAAAAAVVVAFVLGAVVSALTRRFGRGSWLMEDLSRRMRKPLRAVLMVIGVWIAVSVATEDDQGWVPAAEHLLLVAFIVVGAWFVGALAFVIEDGALKRFRTDVADNRHARRARTQITVVRRITVAIIVLCALAGVLLTFPSARAAGASLLASAGVVSIVAGLAAQSALGNVFAGMQIAFTDAIRVDDVVVLEGEWGRIEEITMTYVVVHIWDDRRLILPCTYFTTTPFQNWTRRAAELLGTVEIDLDWDVPVEAMRAELARLLSATELWDKRVGILQITDAVGGYVRVRAMASASDAGTLFDLRCYLREGLVTWLQRSAPQGRPRVRITEGVAEAGPTADVTADARPGSEGAGREPASTTAQQPRMPDRIPVRAARPGVRMRLTEPTRGLQPDPHPAADVDETLVLTAADAAAGGLFTGSAAARERSKAFSGPGQDVMEEREQTARIARISHDGQPPTSGGVPDDGDEGGRTH